MTWRFWRKRRPSGSAPSPEPQRHEYRETWTALSDTYPRALAHVIGDLSEDELRASGLSTLALLESTVGVHAGDTILEIGCGVGRVGWALAPRCATWIGCDVSARMLDFARERLAGRGRVELVEISGFDLSPVPAESVDLVYCVSVFMHLDEWDRYSYICEAHRVLRPGGRIFVDNFNLLSEEGWQIFDAHRRAFPRARPAHISKASTPQELEAYLVRAGFSGIEMQPLGPWIRLYATKSAGKDDV